MPTSNGVTPQLARQAIENVHRHLSPVTASAGRALGNRAVEVAADGCRVRLSDGRSVLDFGSYAVNLLGHRHPDVVAAVRGQLDTMPTGTHSLLNPVAAGAAARVAEYLGGDLPRVHLGLNGADAVEAAVKLARLATGRTLIVAAEGAFHGKSLGALALTHHARFRDGLDDVLSGVIHVPAQDAGAVARETARGDVAAVVFEPVQGENGVRVLNLDVLRAWCAAAAEHGTFVIADEIQAGLRRCGERSVALAAELPVDAVLLGKPLGGGVVPLSAAVCSERLYAPLVADPLLHTATFAGHPLACAALPAALDAVEALADRGPGLAAALADGLSRLWEEHPGIVADVRGRGLLWGVELATPELASRLVIRLARGGLLTSPCLSSPSTVRLLPPLVASGADIDEALDLLGTVLGQLVSPPGAGRGR